jgi:hypothetical protein
MKTAGLRVATPLLLLFLLAACSDDDSAPAAAGAPKTSAESSAATPSSTAPLAAPVPTVSSPSATPSDAGTTVEVPAVEVPAVVPVAKPSPSVPTPKPTAAKPTVVAPSTRSTAAAGWPAEVPYPVDGRVWAVYVGVARDHSDAERARLETLAEAVRAVGYHLAAGVEPVQCEPGAAAALGLAPDADALPVFFSSRADAEQFAATWDRPYVGYVQTTENCIA